MQLSPRATHVWNREHAKHSWLWLFGHMTLLLVAFLPRTLNLGGFVTVDEIDHWIGRSETFLAAVQTHNYAAMEITAHPGVTTMWLGSVGILLHNFASGAQLVSGSDFATRLALMQLPVAVVNACGVLLGYHLLRKLLSAPTAFLAALLWAADPFVIGYSRVLHVDALATTFMTLSALAACVYWNHQGSGWALACSGVCAGLAVLSKSPALVLVPLVVLLALGTHSPRQALLALGVWLGFCALAIALLWPAALVDPLGVARLVTSGVEDNAAVPHLAGNFFLGRVDNTPGALFYPLALAMRTTPISLLGLLAVPFAFRRASHLSRRDMLVLAALIITVVVAMSVFPKKHNRYVLLAFPTLDILAAVGIMHVVSLVRLRLRGQAAVVGIVGALAAANVAFWHPYDLVAYNQLFGGARAGTHTFLTGWGEGLEQTAVWLNQQPDITNVRVATTQASALKPYLLPHVQALEVARSLPPSAGYVVVYIRSTLGELPWAPFDQFYPDAQPVHTITIHGVPYAWIYQVPPHTEHAATARFGDTLRLQGWTLANTDATTFSLNLVWGMLQTNTANDGVFVHVIGPDGQRYAQIDPQLATSNVEAGRFVTTTVPWTLPANAPSGTYQITLGVYNLQSTERLPLARATTADSAIDGVNALLLTHFEKP